MAARSEVAIYGEPCMAARSLVYFDSLAGSGSTEPGCYTAATGAWLPSEVTIHGWATEGEWLTDKGVHSWRSEESDENDDTVFVCSTTPRSTR